ncbi:MAG: hypothetical protein EXR27_05595 [Betaproteobacteria bacterium]|nr:hypothetical protein [Betaproteobacteria bacterium]
MTNENDPMPDDTRWLACIANLPTEDPSARMLMLRTLRSLGCAVMREGAFLLPDTPANRHALTRLSEHITRNNGNAWVMSVTALDDAQTQTFRAFFDRSAKYDELVKSVEALKAGFGISEPVSISRVLAKQRREFDAISALDFFPSEARDRAAEALLHAEYQVNALVFPDAPRSGPVTQSTRNFFRRRWATRRPLWADRLASAWLIRRFIDLEATLIWLDKSEPSPEGAVGFGFQGAPFSNSSGKVTFERLLETFSLQKNTALMKVGALVHYLDAGGEPVAEAAGVATLLHGSRRRCPDDSKFFTESEKTFDLIYEAYFEPPEK